MAYATIVDVFGRFTPIRTMVGVGSYEVASAEVNSMFVADAESFVDAYIGSRYAVPVTPVPPLITQITSDLAIFNMLAEKQVKVPDHVQARYDRQVAILEQLRDGTMVLPSSVALATAGDQEAWANNQDHHSTFSPILDELDQTADIDWIREQQDLRVNDH